MFHVTGCIVGNDITSNALLNGIKLLLDEYKFLHLYKKD